MSGLITITEAVTLIARREARTAADMMEVARLTLEDWERRNPAKKFDQQTLFGGMDDLDAASALILNRARGKSLEIWGRPGRDDGVLGDLPARQLIAKSDLDEKIAFNLLRNDVVPDQAIPDDVASDVVADQASHNDFRGARRVRFFDLCVERSAVDALIAAGDFDRWITGVTAPNVAAPIVDIPKSAASRPTPTQKEVCNWIADRLANWPDDMPAPSEEVDWQAARYHFGEGLRRDEDFRPLRNNHTPPEWQIQGRRRPWGLVKNSATNSAKLRPQK